MTVGEAGRTAGRAAGDRLGSIASASIGSRALSAREVAACAGLLAVLGAAAFGSHVLNGGFYNDDWAYLVAYRYSDGGVLGALGAFSWLSFRPVGVVYWPLLYAILGTQPSGYLAWTVALAVLLSSCLYALLRTLGMERLHAGIIAALVLLFPAADSTRLWLNASISSLGIVFYLLGTLIAVRGLATSRRRGWVFHAGAVCLYLLAIWTYEATAGPILLSLLLYRLRTAWRPALARWLVDVAVIGASVVVLGSRSWHEPQALSAQVGHAARIAREALSILTSAALPLGKPGTVATAALLAGLAAAGVVVWRLLDERDPARGELRRWLAIAVAGGVALGAGYLAYVPADADVYSPLRPGQHNRVNNLASIGYVTLVYSLVIVAGTLLFRGLSGRVAWGAAFALLAGCMIAFGYVQRLERHAAHWDRSARMQEQVLASVRGAVPRPPRGAVLYTFGHPTEAAPGVPVFSAAWDLDGAVKVTWDDPSLAAYPAIPGTTFLCGESSFAARNANNDYLGPQAAQSSPYGSAFVIDVASSRAIRIRDRSACRSAAQSFDQGALARSGVAFAS